jgi:hypothetical protein
MPGRPISERTKNYARLTVLGWHNVEIQIVRQEQSLALNETTGLIEAAFDTGYTGYEGTARFWLSNDGVVAEVGEGDYSTVSTYISLAWDAEPVPELDDYVIITAAYDDPTLVDKVFRIKGIDGGGFMRAARRLTVVADTSNRDTR